MSLREQIPALVEKAKANECYLAHNAELYDIYQGNLLKYVEEALGEQLSPQAFNQAKHRIPPINLLKRIMDKLAKVYASAPNREIVGGNQTDKDLLGWYSEHFAINRKMGVANVYFNLFKNCLLEPYLYQADSDEPGEPRLRIIPSDRFVVYSTDSKDGTVPTGVITYEGKYRPTPTGQPRKYFKATTKSEVIYFDEDKRDCTAQFAPENPEGINEYGVLPYVYINRSETCIMPVQDSDTRRMAVLIPALLADTNYASMFQAFAVMYGINVTFEKLEKDPSAFWAFKTEAGSEQKPEIGTIKTEMDVDGSLNLIASQLAFWLNSRGIRPGAVGDVNGSNFSSGISKMIDEMDTAEDRKEQIPYFKEAEEKLWRLVFSFMHPVWSANGLLENRAVFTPTAKVTTTFPDQVPLTKRKDVIEEAVTELNNGLTTKERALKKINPELTDDEIQDLMAEIEAEKSAATPVVEPVAAPEADDAEGDAA